ncbi:magnesium transporter [Thermoanaerobacterium sp. DL9XJH110]|uniref:magnesium transporter n=1 Tax=Thermoanaerobacterium sp. DL9XJH110 TaxID=3386643 RepID=UPI003BB634CE
MLPKKDILLLKHLIVNEKADEIRNILAKLHPADIAGILAEIKNGNKKLFFRLMDTSKAAEVLEEFEPSERLTLMEEMTEAETIKILENMSVDEIIDLFQEMPNSRVERLLSKLPGAYYDEIKSLLKLAEDTAGGLMTTDYVYLFSDITVNEAIEVVRKFGQEAETIYYLYVVDDKKHLVGVLSLRELISAPREKKIHEIMHKKVVSVDVGCDQEEVARIISKYSLLAVPVVDRENRLLGIVTVDDALEVMEKENTEDIHKMAGISPQEDVGLTSTVWGASKRRIFWLVVCLLGDLLSGFVIDGYSSILQSVVAVAFFIPVLMATGGNVGTQSLALAVRGLATGELNRKNILKFMGGETLAGLIVGVICGSILATAAFVWQKNLLLGLAVGTSMGIALMFSAFTGIFIPLLFNIFKIDPAVASGPFITTVVDVCTLIIYFTFSMLFLSSPAFNGASYVMGL